MYVLRYARARYRVEVDGVVVLVVPITMLCCELSEVAEVSFLDGDAVGWVRPAVAVRQVSSHAPVVVDGSAQVGFDGGSGGRCEACEAEYLTPGIVPHGRGLLSSVSR